MFWLALTRPPSLGYETYEHVFHVSGALARLADQDASPVPVSRPPVASPPSRLISLADSLANRYLTCAILVLLVAAIDLDSRQQFWHGNSTGGGGAQVQSGYPVPLGARTRIYRLPPLRDDAPGNAGHDGLG